MSLLNVDLNLRLTYVTSYSKEFRDERLSQYALSMSERYVQTGFDDPKIPGVFKKFPFHPGNNKLKLSRIPLTEEQLDRYLESATKELKGKINDVLKNVSKPYTKEKINNMLQLVKQSEFLPGEELFDLGSLLVEKVRAMVISNSEDAEVDFRNHPSTENFSIWLATWKMIDIVCADFPESKAPSYLSLNNKPYTVLLGDTLPKIAQVNYGYANLWDIIWFQSGANFHPDRIMLGQKLILP